MKSKPASTAKPTPTSAISTTLRRFLYVTAAFTGAAIMIIEILGAKMLSPYFGLSHFVWTAQIAVTLVALACGYYTGGRYADRDQDLSRLYWAILGAAAYLAVGVLLCKPIAYQCLELNLAVGSLLASTILFFVPLALLAMTGPFLVRVITSSVVGLGASVGRLTAVGTLGSFAGTLLIGYVMIPHLPNSVTMFLTSLSLLLVCSSYFGFFRRPSFGPLLLILLLSLLTGLSLRVTLRTDSKSHVELFNGNSNFGQLQVVDLQDGSERYYLNDFLVQNTYDPMNKLSMSQFTYALAGLARIYTTNITDVLCIGMGVGIVPMDFANHHANVDVVEINPAIVPVAAKYFNLETNKLHLTLDDGRHFLNKTQKKYDAVILDAFLGDSSPSHLLTHEAFSSIRSVLRPGGVLVINAFGDTKDGHDFFASSLELTLKSVFANVHIHGNGDGGLFYVGSDRDPLEPLRQPDLSKVHPEVLRGIKNTYDGIEHTTPDHGIVLTDDYNPAEFYDARNREELRRFLASEARKM